MPASSDPTTEIQLIHALQELQAVNPAFSDVSPVGHAVHAPAPSPALYLPLSQNKHFEAPVSEKLPAGHGTQRV